MTSMKAREAALCAQKFFGHHQLRGLSWALSAADRAWRGALRMRSEFDGSGPLPAGQRRHCRKAGAHAHCLKRLSGLTRSSKAVLQLRDARTRSDSSGRCRAAFCACGREQRGRTRRGSRLGWQCRAGIAGSPQSRGVSARWHWAAAARCHVTSHAGWWRCTNWRHSTLKMVTVRGITCHNTKDGGSGKKKSK